MSILTRNTAAYAYIDPEIVFKSSVSTSTTTDSAALTITAGIFQTNIAASSSVSIISLLKGNESGVIDFISLARPVVSGSSDAAEISTLYEFGVLFSGAWEATTSTTNAELGVLREISATVSASSETTDAVFDAGRFLQSAVASTSSTENAALDISCLMVGAVSAESVAGNINLLLTVQFAMASAAASSTTGVTLGVLRELAQAISVDSSSTDIGLLVLREVAATIATTSLAPTIGVLVLRPWISSVSASSDTTAPPLLKEISLGSMASTWGEQYPTSGERARPWDFWKDDIGGDVEIGGDPSWGKAAVGTGDTILSPVLYAGTGTHHFSLLRDIYGTGIGSVTMYIRGDTSSFGQLDGTPTWSEYTGPVNQAWAYVQMRIDG